MSSGPDLATPLLEPSPYAGVLAEVTAAEQAEGWLVRCDEEGRYLALSAPLVDALAATLRSLGGRVLEVCAGDGALAAALRGRGIEVVATDARPPAHPVVPVEPLDAAEALRRHRPRVVLGSFVPVDSGVDRWVLESPGVEHYLVLNARLGGELGARCLWTHPGWTRARLESATRWMVCRHDVWLGPATPLLTRGEAWWLHRLPGDPAQERVLE